MDFTIEDGYEVLRRELVNIKVILVEYYEKMEPEYAERWPAMGGTVAVVIAQRVKGYKTPPVFLTGKNAGSCEIKGLLASVGPASTELEIKPLTESQEPPRVSGVEDRVRAVPLEEEPRKEPYPLEPTEG